jgi:hypothetical protein
MALRCGPHRQACSAPDPTARFRLSDEQARTTHRDLRAPAAAVLVADVVADALQQPDETLPVGGEAWCEVLARRVDGIDPDLGAGLRALPGWLAADPAVAAEQIASAGNAPRGAAHQFERWHGISPFATRSALYAVYAYARTPGDPEAVLRTAVSVGGDVDTVAAMAGAMVGARLGVSAFSPRLLLWAEHLTDQGRWGARQLADLGASCYDGRPSIAPRSIRSLMAELPTDLWFQAAKSGPLAGGIPAWVTEREPWRSQVVDELRAVNGLGMALDGIGRQIAAEPPRPSEPFDTWWESCGPVTAVISRGTDMGGMRREECRVRIGRVARECCGWRVVAIR